MILDSSAIVAVLTDEPEGPAFRHVIFDADAVRMSAAGLVEVGAVLDRRGLSAELDQFLSWCRAEISPVTVAQAILARSAYRRFGRGSGHSAQLNFGDCFSYALAVDMGEPLLFKGNDFSLTDVQVADERDSAHGA